MSLGDVLRDAGYDVDLLEDKVLDLEIKNESLLNDSRELHEWIKDLEREVFDLKYEITLLTE